jgi:hypothetical protein
MSTEARESNGQHYFEKAEVNGVRVECSFYDDSAECYELHFPQAEATRQNIRISEDPRVAEVVFHQVLVFMEKKTKGVEDIDRIVDVARAIAGVAEEHYEEEEAGSDPDTKLETVRGDLQEAL